MPLTDFDIERIATGVVTLSLPKPQWTHAAHWAAALWLIRSPAHDAVAEMPGLIRAYNSATGGENTDTSGYHETITLASLRAARHWLARHPDAPLSQVLAALLASPLGRSDWPLAHWTRERLFSPEARRAWLDPDLQPLPF